MKKTIFALMLALAVTAAFAQNEGEQNWRGYLHRHEVGIGIGDPLVSILYRAPLHWGCDVGRLDSPENWLNDDVHGDIYTTCPISFHYLYRVTKFLWLGGDLSYCGVYGRKYLNAGTVPDGWIKEHYIALMPTIRFSYLNKKYVTLYSGFSTGLLLAINGQGPATECSAHFTGQLTAFGVSAGDRWYGYTEIGFGYKGVISAGFGYRFNSRKSNN